jgi:hypothetical protein
MLGHDVLSSRGKGRVGEYVSHHASLPIRSAPVSGYTDVADLIVTAQLPFSSLSSRTTSHHHPWDRSARHVGAPRSAAALRHDQRIDSVGHGAQFLGDQR